MKFWTGPVSGPAAATGMVSVKASECPRISEAFLKEERAALGEWWFRQEYLCEFLEMEGALFTEEMIQRAFSEDIKPLEIPRR